MKTATILVMAGTQQDAGGPAGEPAPAGKPTPKKPTSPKLMKVLIYNVTAATAVQ
jgi:hypothetical protein